MCWLLFTMLQWTLGYTCLSQLWFPRCVCPALGLMGHKAENKDHGIRSHHFMGNRWGNSGNSVRLYFSVLQNHYRWWLQPRKVMTNRDSIFKSRDITLPTKVCLVKAMFFQLSCMDVRVMLWRKLSAEELMLLNCGVGEDSRESLGLQGDPTRPSWRRSALGFLWKEWC